MKIVITGGSGFIGSNVADALLSAKHHVTIVDNLSRHGVFKNLFWLMSRHKKFDFYQADIRDEYKMRKLIEGADVVFHFAAQTAVTTSVEDPRSDFEINAFGTFNVLEAARLSKKKPFVIYSSTNKVYGEFNTNIPVSEHQKINFCTPYGCSKGAGDQYVIDYYKNYGVPGVVLRMSCIYGNRQMGTSDQGWLAHFAINKDKPVTVFGTGEQIRDALYIDDYVDLMKLLIDNQKDVAGQVFNIGGGKYNVISVNEALEKIGNTDISFDKWRPSDQKYYVSDISKIYKYVGWKPKLGIDEGLNKLVEWTNTLKK